MTLSLLTKYRPTTFDEVVGQKSAVKALRAAVEDKRTRSFLFTGPPGTGKTTLARIVAAELGCKPEDLLEVDAATNTGVDNVRALQEILQYVPLGEGRIKVAIVDESHSLSKNAWQALLKVVEEPPAHVGWMFCTTEPTKVPASIISRCFRLDLKPVGAAILEDLLLKVAQTEKMDIDDDIIGLCADEANGSPRQALANLGVCSVASDVDEAAELLRSAGESAEAVDLARLLVRGGGWGEARKLLSALAEVNPESVRHIVRAYVTKVVLGAKSDADAGRALEILDEFSQPINPNDGLSPIVLATGRLLLS